MGEVLSEVGVRQRPWWLILPIASLATVCALLIAAGFFGPRRADATIGTDPARGGFGGTGGTVAGACLPADAYEGNDTQLTAAHFGVVGHLNVVALNTHTYEDEDWFSFVPAADAIVTVDIWFHQHGGDLDLQLYDAAGELLAVSNSSNDFESVKWMMIAGETYAARVYTEAGACNGYGLVVYGPDYAPDPFEVNDTFETPTDLGTLQDLAVPDLTIHSPEDQDWFSFVPCVDGPFGASIAFWQAVGDLNLVLHDDAGALLVSSTGATDGETVLYYLSAGERYLLQVYGQHGNRSAYSMTLEGPDPALDCNDNGLDDGCEAYGDLDGDRDVDLSDHGAFRDILTGPGGTASCTSFDVDADGDVDLAEWSVLQARFSP